MKKGLSVALAAALIASVAIMPVSAAEFNGEAITVVASQDFEGTDHELKPYSAEDRFGAKLVAGKINGNAVRLNRGGSVVNQTIDWLLAGDKDITSGKALIQFSFMAAKLDGYGAAIRFAQTADEMKKNWEGGATDIAIIGPDTGTEGDPYLAFTNGGDPRSDGVRTKLELNKVYTLSLVFTIGSNKYEAYLNNEKLGEYTYASQIDSVRGIRLYHHGYSTDEDSKKDDPGAGDEVYYDDFMLATFGAAGGDDPAPTPDPDPTPSTGDALAVSAIVMAAAAGAALVISKKRK